MRKNGCSKNPNEQRTVKNDENDGREKLGGSQSVLAANTEPFSILVFRFAIGFRQVWQVGSFLAHTRTYTRVLFKTSTRLIARHRCNKHLTEESVREKKRKKTRRRMDGKAGNRQAV